MGQDRDRSKTTQKQYARMARDQKSAGADKGGTGQAQSAKPLGYSEKDLQDVPKGAIEMSWGCGNPAALAELREGQVVLDLGSGAGLDAFVAARRVGPNGRVIGVDMTPEMVAKAAEFAREGRYENVEFRLGHLEVLPLADESVDVIISNCVINYCPDKVAAFREVWRVLRPGGCGFVSDLVVEGQGPPADTPGLDVWVKWLKVACGKGQYLDALAQAGFNDLAVLTERFYEGPALTEALAGTIVSLDLRFCKRARAQAARHK